MKKTARQILAAICVFLLTGSEAAAQNKSTAPDIPFKTQYILGINYMPEWQISNTPAEGPFTGCGFTSNFGLSFEARFTRHSGIETGFYYRNVKFPGGTVNIYPDPYRYPATYQRYFSIPVLYKFHSRIVNVGAGVTYDFMFDHTLTRLNNEGDELDKHRIGVMIKVSKDIKLYKGLFLEPEFHYNPFWAKEMDNRFWMGFQIGLKYRF